MTHKESDESMTIEIEIKSQIIWVLGVLILVPLSLDVRDDTNEVPTGEHEFVIHHPFRFMIQRHARMEVHHLKTNHDAGSLIKKDSLY